MPSCSVPYCAQASGKDTTVTFHEFPHETPLFLNKWLEKIGRPNWRPGLRSVICSDHFDKDDFDRQGRLRIGSFPCKFPDPPFRKRKKLETDQGESLPSNAVTAKQVVHETETTKKGPAANSSAPVMKVVLTNLGDISTPVKLSQNVKSLTYVSKVPTQGITKSLAEGSDENVSSGGIPNVMTAKPLNSATTSMTASTSKPSNFLEIPKKRRILEEAHSSTLNSDQVASVTSSFSLLACRVCGATNANHVNIFGPDGLKEHLPELISKCLPVQVSQSDSLPLSVCHLCIARLKLCRELIDTSVKTNNSFRSGNAKLQANNKESDPPIIHSKPVRPTNSDDANRRVLLLEMSLTESMPVRSMITHALSELRLRLQPKESRDTKPEGRIMFLDLHGPPEAYAEQIKKAVSMLFPSSSGPMPMQEKRLVDVKTVMNMVPGPSKTVKSVPKILPKGSVPNVDTQSTVLPQVSAVLTKGMLSNGHSPELVVSTRPVISATSTVCQSKGPSSLQTPTTMPTLVMSKVNSPSVSGNVILQTSSVLPGVPISVMSNASVAATPVRVATFSSTNASGAATPVRVATFPSTNASGAATPVRVATFPSTSSSGTAPKIIHLPSTSNFINIQPKPTVGLPVTPVARILPSHEVPEHTGDDHEPESAESGTQSELNPPALFPFNENLASKEKPPETLNKGTAHIDLTKMKNQVVTKLNNMGNQFKLGDKIFGIVLRSCDTTENIQRKLQSTFVGAVPVKSGAKTLSSPKEKSIATKGSLSIPVEIVNGVRKLSKRPMEVPSAIQDPSVPFDRRYTRKLSLGFLWRRTGFLVSSYQKLFTWQMSASTDNVDSAYPVLTCRVCKFEASSKGQVETHLQAHPDLQCSICWKYFLTVGKVHEHMSVIHCLPAPSEIPKRKTLITWRLNNVRRNPLRQYQCSRCDRRFKLKDGLERHIGVCKERTISERIIAINKGSVIRCPICNRSFPSQEHLEDHMLGHKKRTSWLCDVCGSVLKSASNYRSHVARHDENAHEYQFQCGICRKRFKLQHRYDDHVKKHDEENQFICASCGKVFRTLGGLRQHEILHGERKHQCSFCPSRFHRRDHLRIHESSHNNSNNRRRARRDLTPAGTRMFTCRYCIAAETEATVVKFPTMRELLRHYNDDHPNERAVNIPGAKRFVCERCNRSFANSTLLKHHHMWHAGLYPYTCSHCGQGFMVKERLRNHEWIHTNERPFKCQTCGKGFRSRNCLKQHKVIHNDPSKFFKCKYCDKTFSRIDNLRTHTRVHTGEKPWKCLDCQKQFRLRSECTKHIQIAHNVPSLNAKHHMETLFDPNNHNRGVEEDGSADSNSAESAIEVAIAGITTVQDMELLIESEEIEEIGGTEVM